MSTDIVTTMKEMESLAVNVAHSGLFGIKTPEQALVLMAIAQAEGHPAALAARDYDVIQGRPAKKAEALLRDFLQGGGRVQWHQLDDTVADATFSHPAGGEVRIQWTIERAEKIKMEEWRGPKDNRTKVEVPLASRPQWRNYPRAMLRSRCISEGVRTVYPIASGSMMTPEELRDEVEAEPKDVTPQQEVIAAPVPQSVTIDQVREAYRAASDVTAFNAARKLAALLPEHDKAEARMLDRVTVARLKGEDQQQDNVTEQETAQ